MAPALCSAREALAILNMSSPSSIGYLVNTGVLAPVHKGEGVRGAYVFERAHVEAVAKARDAK